MPIRMLTWNCRRASANHGLWQHFLELSPDIAVLQEVTGVPSGIRDAYELRSASPPTKGGNPQRFQSVLLVRGSIEAPVALRSDMAWVNRELEYFSGSFLNFRVRINESAPLTIVGVYAPAWPVARGRIAMEDVTAVKLTQNPDVWVSDLLVAALRVRPAEAADWIVAGDFNTCETFDSWKGGPRGNREWLDRMKALNFTECLRHAQGRLTPTFRKPGASEARSQIDHLFVTEGLAARLRQCATSKAAVVFGGGLSDHLPIVADFAEPPGPQLVDHLVPQPSAATPPAGSAA